MDEDLERAKQEAAKRAVSSQLVSDQKDSKESLKMMLALKEERRAELAKKGFLISIVVAVIGIAAAVVFYLLYSGDFFGLSYKSGMSGAANVLRNSSLYIAIVAGILSITLITGIGGLKSLTSVVYLILGIIQIFPGIVMISQHNGSLGLVGALYGVSLVCTIAVFVMLSASEALGEFYKKSK